MLRTGVRHHAVDPRSMCRHAREDIDRTVAAGPIDSVITRRAYTGDVRLPINRDQRRATAVARTRRTFEISASRRRIETEVEPLRISAVHTTCGTPRFSILDPFSVRTSPRFSVTKKRSQPALLIVAA